MMPKFDPELVMRELLEYSITNLFLVPTHFAGIFQLGEKHLSAYRRDTLRALVSNAAPLSFEMKERIVDLFGPDVLFEAYGSTEGGTVTMIRPLTSCRKQEMNRLPSLLHDEARR